MYGYYEDESRRAGCEKTAAAHREAAALFPAIRKTFESFDGKVFNCRLEKALQEATGRRVFVRKDSYSLEVYAWFSDYRGSSHYTLAHIQVEKLIDGKRIPAALLVESARGYREKHLQEAAALDIAPDTVPTTAQHIKYFIEQANKLVDTLPYSVREMYRISAVRMY